MAAAATAARSDLDAMAAARSNLDDLSFLDVFVGVSLPWAVVAV